MLTEYEAGRVQVIQNSNVVIGLGTEWLLYAQINDTITINNWSSTIINIVDFNQLEMEGWYPYSDDTDQEYTITRNYALLQFETSNSLSGETIIANGTDLVNYGPSLPNPTTVTFSTIAEQSDDDFQEIVTDGELNITCSYPDTITVTLSAYGYEDYTFEVVSDYTIIPSIGNVNAEMGYVNIISGEAVSVDLLTVTSTTYSSELEENVVWMDLMSVGATVLNTVPGYDESSTILVDTTSVTATTKDAEAGQFIKIDTLSVQSTMLDVEIGRYINTDTASVSTTMNDITLNDSEFIFVDASTVLANAFDINEVENDIDTASVSTTMNDITIVETPITRISVDLMEVWADRYEATIG